MARIDYADINAEGTQQLVGRIAGERGSVLHLYRMLLNSPPVAEGWLNLLTAIRQKCVLDDDVRELAIMRIAALNDASYEAEQHRPIALKAGLESSQLDALAARHFEHDCFDERQCAVIALTDEMTVNVAVADNVMNNILAFFGPQEVVELVTTIAAYNMVSRFLVALDIRSDDVVAAE